MVAWRNAIPAFARWAGPVLVCVLVPALLVLSTIERHPRFSPIDEGAHFDYVERIYRDGIPTFGDRLLRTSLRELACRGTRLDGLVVPPCDAKIMKYDLFPSGAYQYEAQQPPLYYAATAPPAKAIQKVLGVAPLGATRVVGLFWLVAGLLVLWKTSRILNVASTPMLATLLAISTAPNVVYYSSIVTNDSTGILYGALAAYLGALAYTRSTRHLIPAVLVGLAAALTKTSCALPVGVVGLILVTVTMGRERSSDAQRRIMRSTGLGMIGGALAGTLLWVGYYRTVASIEPKKLPTFDVLRSGPVDFGDILNQAKSFLAPLTDSYNPFASWNGDIYNLLAILGILALAAGLAAGAYTRERSWWSVSGPIVLACLYVGGVIIGLGIWRAYDVNPGVSARYALPMLPLIALIVPAGLQRRVGQAVYSAGCVGSAALSIWMITHVSLA